MTRDWNSYGITWLSENVSKTEGSTKVQLNGTAQIPSVTDLDKVIDHFGVECVTGSLNGTSWRVMAQDVCRRMLKVGKHDVDEMQEAVYNRLRGVRNAAVGGTKTIEVKVYALPNGASYSGTSLIEYQQAFVAAMFDCGVANDVAIAMAQKLTL